MAGYAPSGMPVGCAGETSWSVAGSAAKSGAGFICAIGELSGACSEATGSVSATDSGELHAQSISASDVVISNLLITPSNE